MLRAGRWPVILAVVLVAAICGGREASAQSLPPPHYTAIDSHGVDLTSGALTLPGMGVSVGPPGSGLAWSFTSAGSFLGNLDGAVFVSLNTGITTVSIGRQTAEFANQGLGNVDGSGDTLAGGYNNYVYTTADGTAYTYGLAGGYGRGDYPGQAYILGISKPDGEVLSYTYTTYVDPAGYDSFTGNTTFVHLQAITSNRGYQIHFTYDGTYPTKLTKVMAINTAVDACDPGANDCGSLSHNWPTLSVGYSYAGQYPDYSSPYAWSVSAISNGAVAYSETYNLIPGQGLTIQRMGLGAITVNSSINELTSNPYGDRDANMTLTDGSGSTWTYQIQWRADPNWSDPPGSNTAAATRKQATVTDPAGKTRTIGFDWEIPSDGLPGFGKVISDTDENGNQTTIQYSGAYNSGDYIAKITHPEGDSENYTYDGRGNVTQYQKLPRPGYGDSQTMKADYPASCSGQNPDGSLIAAANCNKPLDTYIWDGANQLSRTDYRYNTDGTLSTVTKPPNASGVRQVVSYSNGYVGAQSGTVTRLMHIYQCQDPAQATCSGAAETVTDIAYTGSTDGSPTSVATHAGDNSVSSSTSMTYDVVGNVHSVTGPLGQTATYAYDMALRRPTGEVDSSINGGPSPATVITYGANGQVATVSQGTATGGVSTGGDQVNGFTAVATATTQYDQVGRKIQDYALGNDGQATVTNYSYDALGRPYCTAIRMNPSALNGPMGTPLDACAPSPAGANGPDRISVSYYDFGSRLTSLVQANGVSGQQRTYVQIGYGADGEKLTETDANNNVTGYDYDGILRLSHIRYPDPSSGQASASGQEGFGYDAMGNLNAHTLRDGTPLSAVYDALGNRTTDWNGAILSYDHAGHVVSASLSSHTVTMAYDALGRMTSESAPSGATGYAYDAAGGLTRLTWSDGNYVTYNRNAATDAVTAILENGGSALASYSYNDYGQRTGSSQLNGTSTGYGYDGLSRLASLNQTLTSQSQALGFSYNPAGQIATKTASNPLYDWIPPAAVTRSYSNDRLNRVTNSAGNTISYGDGRGNLTSDGINSYSYSNLNQLTGYTGPSSSAALTYDGLGRLWKTYSSSTTTTQFAYMGDQLVAEYDSSGNITNRYVPGPDGQDDPVVWYQGPDLTQKRYLHADNQGTVIAVTDSTGSLVGGQPYTYDEYGVPASTNSGRFQYTGQLWIPEIGLYHYKARAYSPTLGRFMQTDPIGYDDDYNLYAYVGNDPVNGTDPSGLADVFPGDCTGTLICSSNNAISASGGLPLDGLMATGNVQNPGWMPGPCVGSCVVDHYGITTDPATGRTQSYDTYWRNLGTSAGGLWILTSGGSSQGSVDISKMVQYMDQHALPRSQGLCARYCRLGFEAGGMNTAGHPRSAKDYGPFLLSHGAIPLPPGTPLHKGDVAVFSASPGHPDGHIEVFDGHQWVSDFKQNNFSPYRNQTPPNVIYRLPQ